MGRSPCCDKVGLKKGPWAPEEDQKLLAYIEEHGHGSWRSLPAKAGLERCGKSCRLRWTNYLRPDIKRGKFSLQEEKTIIQLHALLGNRWSAIATHLPMRTDNEIKNYWNTHLKKRLAKMGIDPTTHKPQNETLISANAQSKCEAANLSHMAQWESARLEAEARLVRESKLSYSSSFVQPHPGTSDLDSGSDLGQSQSLRFEFDVLKAWQGVWSKSTKCEIVSDGANSNALESPTTSTLSFSENSIQFPGSGFIKNPTHSMEFMGNSSTREEGLIKEECVTFGAGHHDMVFSMEEDPWTSESHETRTEHIPITNFMDGFNDLLLDNSNDPNSSMGRVDSDIADLSGFDDSDKQNYWNSVLKFDEFLSI